MNTPFIIMEEEKNEDIQEDVQEEELEEETSEDSEDSSEETTDWKAEAEKWKGIAKRNKTKAEKKAEAPEPKKESNKFNHGTLALLKVSGVEAPAQIEYLQKLSNRTGEDVSDLLSDDYVQNKLNELGGKEKTLKATPSGTKRGAPSSNREDVDYWIKKGELPEDQLLKRKVVRKKRELAEKKNMFSDNPIQGGF